MEKIHGNTHVFVLSCEFVTSKHKNMRVSMYFLHLELTFTPHYIITDIRTITYIHIGTYLSLKYTSILDVGVDCYDRYLYLWGTCN